MSGLSIHTPRDIQQMARACRLAADLLVEVGSIIRPGLTTDEIDDFVRTWTEAHGAASAPLGYKGFPRSVCTSVNEVVCHGIPEARVLVDGDIVNVDVTPLFPRRGGFHGDSSITYYVGEPSPLARHIVETAREALEVGICAVRPGGRIGDIGAAIEDFVHAKGCSIVREYLGHGVGRAFHTQPNVPHYRSGNPGPRLRKGMTFTIEPMINLGGYDIELLDDGWTVLTRDHSLSAQFEHTIVVTDGGCEVLTRRNARVVNSEDQPGARLGERSCWMPGEDAVEGEATA